MFQSRDGDGTVRTDREESDGDINMEGGDGNKYDQEGVGFRDNGVCSQFFFFNEVTNTYYSSLDVNV